MSHKVTLIPGDGIGPEVTKATVRILEATGVKFEWETFQVGADAFEKYGEYIPKEVLESIERTSVGLKGPVTTPVGGGFSSINVALRQKFELYANFRPIRNLPHIPTRYPDVDLIIVRENTESLYSGLEHYGEGLDAHCKICLRVCPQESAEENPRHPQGQHHEAFGWTVLAVLPQRSQRISRDYLWGAYRG
jgi:isocitrate/isopropylmalate dehydrogenase